MTTRKGVRVEPALCEAHALCIEIAPRVFDLDDDVAVAFADPDDTHRHDVEAAIAACPRQAISWTDVTLTTVPKGPAA